MPYRKTVVIGASAGGVEALVEVCQELPHDLDAAVLIVMHMSATAKSALPQILSRTQRLGATYPVDGQKIQSGRIYVAPPDWHLMMRDKDHIWLSRGPREHSCRPAVDPLFRSAAAVCGPNTIGVVLSGTLDDGTAGLQAIKDAGGTTIVQHPKDAMFPGMPLSAVEHVVPDYILSAGEIGKLIGQLVSEGPVEFKPAASSLMDIEVAIGALRSEPEATKKLGAPSEFACPECGGTLWSIPSQGEDRFRCRVGHAFSPGSLLDEQTVQMERALWTAYRALREKTDLAKRVAERMLRNNHSDAANRYQREAEKATREANGLMDLLRDRQAESPENLSSDEEILEQSPNSQR